VVRALPFRRLSNSRPGTTHPSASEVTAGGIFCTAAPDGSTITLKANPVEREALLAQGAPFYVPPYVGDKGWLGVRSDHPRIDWDEVAELIAVAVKATA
jgi:hypothetical protein